MVESIKLFPIIMRFKHKLNQSPAQP